MASRTWAIVCEPEGKNPGLLRKNEGGIVVYITDGNAKHEIARVAWVRRNGANPDTPFDKQLRTEIAKGEDAITVINELEAKLEEIRNGGGSKELQ